MLHGVGITYKIPFKWRRIDDFGRLEGILVLFKLLFIRNKMGGNMG